MRDPSDKLHSAAHEAHVDGPDSDADFKPLNREQAERWRSQQLKVSPWRILGLQLGVGAVFVLLVLLLTGREWWAASAAWGVLCAWVPAAVFAAAMVRSMRLTHAAGAWVGLLAWELVKMVLTILLLLLTVQLLKNVSWLALVAGFVVTMKAFWLAWPLGWMKRKGA